MKFPFEFNVKSPLKLMYPQSKFEKEPPFPSKEVPLPFITISLYDLKEPLEDIPLLPFV